MPRFIDRERCEITEPGSVGFLVEIMDLNTGSCRYALKRYPARANISHEPRLNGWCGNSNNLAVRALGLYRVVKTASNGCRIRVAPVAPSKLAAELESLGYPELGPDNVRTYTLIEYMPVWIRSSHEKAGNAGVYPINGSERVAIEGDIDADLLDPEWSSVLRTGLSREDAERYQIVSEIPIDALASQEP